MRGRGVNYDTGFVDGPREPIRSAVRPPAHARSRRGLRRGSPRFHTASPRPSTCPARQAFRADGPKLNAFLADAVDVVRASFIRASFSGEDVPLAGRSRLLRN